MYTKHHSHSSPAVAESDSNPTAAAPSQTEITDLNCSDQSTTSKEMAAWRALVPIRHGLRIRLHDTLWCDCDTVAYDPEELGKT